MNVSNEAPDDSARARLVDQNRDGKVPIQRTAGFGMMKSKGRFSVLTQVGLMLASIFFVLMLLWSPFWFFFLKYRYFSSELYDDVTLQIRVAGLDPQYPISAVPDLCVRDEVGYALFDCDDIPATAIDLLETGHTRLVVVPSRIPDIVKAEDKRLGDRVLLHHSNGRLEYDIVDRSGVDQRYPFGFDCKVTFKSPRNFFGIYIVREICGYNREFAYSLVGMGSRYGYPYNPTGESVMPLRVTNWINYHEKTEVDK